MATKRIKGTQEDFEKALDKINPDQTTHYNKKSSEEDIQETGDTKTEKVNRDAVRTLIIGCQIAQKEGAYTLEEARTIMNAIDFLNSTK